MESIKQNETSEKSEHSNKNLNKHTDLKDDLEEAPNPSVTHFSSSLYYDTDLVDAIENFEENPDISDITLNFTSIQESSGLNFDPLIDSLKNLKQISTLNFAFKDCSNILGKIIKSLSEIIIPNKALVHLGLSFAWCAQMTIESAQEISNLLKSIDSIKSLRLEFSSCQALDNDGIKLISSSIGITSLQEFSFVVHMCGTIADDSLSELSSSLLKLLSLSKLRITLPSEKISVVGVKSLSVTIKELKNLNDLHLSMDGSPLIDDESMKYLSESLKNFQSLKNLQLSFSYNPTLTDKTLTALGASLRKSNSLENLQIFFSGCDGFVGEGITNLLKELSENDKINKFTLYLNKCQEIAEFQARLPKNLNELSINFSSSKKITEKGPFDLFKSIQNLKLLSNLTLQLNSCSNVTDGEIIVLSDSLKGLEKLEILNLQLSSLEKLTNESLSNIFLSISGLKVLSKINFSFDECKFTSEVLIKCSKVIKELEGLQNMLLNMWECENVSDDSILELIDDLGNCKVLKEAKLNFSLRNGARDSDKIRAKLKSLKLQRSTVFV